MLFGGDFHWKEKSIIWNVRGSATKISVTKNSTVKLFEKNSAAKNRWIEIGSEKVNKPGTGPIICQNSIISVTDKVSEQVCMVVAWTFGQNLRWNLKSKIMNNHLIRLINN